LLKACHHLEPVAKEFLSPDMSKIEQSKRGLTPSRIVPPLSALLAFERVAAHLSFRRAARELSVSPSAISHQIKSLEERFGMHLFVRVGRSVVLTDEGKRYLQTVRSALLQLEEGSRDLLDRIKDRERVLRISAMPFFTRTVLIPHLAKFQASHPKLDLRIDATHEYANFDERLVDAAIRYGRDRSQGLRLDALLSVSGQPVCSPKLAATLREPEDLRKATLINLVDQPRAWPAWLSEIVQQAVVPKSELWFDNVPAALEAAEHGLGVALAMYPLIKGWPAYGRRLVAPFDVQPHRTATLYLVTRPQDAHDRRIRNFRRWLLDAVKAVAGGNANG
jgi:LysR family glycine cleavage system transcriptional activator